MPNEIVDLSGVSFTDSDNPFDALIESSHNDPVEIQSRYDAHRQTRNAQQKEKMLDPSFSGAILDPIFLRVINPSLEPGFQDPRHCLVFWARPPRKVKNLVAEVQRRLKEAAPHLWLMPPANLHINTLEITHSRSAQEIDQLARVLSPAVPALADYPQTHRARLVKPLLGFDAAAVALTYVPAAGEASRDARRGPAGDAYTYHHLRRGLHARAAATGVAITSRYTVPSAHLTVARFVGQDDFAARAPGAVDAARVRRWVRALEDVNAWLVAEYWPRGDGGAVGEGGEWVVGEEVGLDHRRGTLWYGGGETVRLGRGF